MSDTGEFVAIEAPMTESNIRMKRTCRELHEARKVLCRTIEVVHKAHHQVDHKLVKSWRECGYSLCREVGIYFDEYQDDEGKDSSDGNGSQ